MVTTVTANNQVTVPASIARKAGIRAGARLDWRLSDRSNELVIRVLPDQARLASEIMGAGRRFLKPGADPIADLIREREREDHER